MAHDIFISYSSKDKIYADAICAALEKSKRRCWIAPRDILPGENWGEAIVDAISESKIMVIIFSANSNASQQVIREVERAVFKNIPIIPFRIQDIKPTKSMEFFLSTPHWLDAIDDDKDKHIVELLETIDRILNPISQEEETTAELSEETFVSSIEDSMSQSSDGDYKKKNKSIGIKAVFILLIIISTAFATTILSNRIKDSKSESERNSDGIAVENRVDTPSSEEDVDTTTATTESGSEDDSSEKLDSDDAEENFYTENYADVVVLITTGNIYDSLIKSDLWAGVVSASDYYYLESYLYETDYYLEFEAIEGALYYGSDIIILQGEELSGYIEVYAPDNPDVQFVLIDGVSDYQGSNFIQMNFIDNEAIFVAGYIASLETATDNVAFVGIDGVTDSKYNVLFENGATYNGDVEVFNLDVKDALEFIIAYDIDVVYNMAGDDGNYLIDLAEQNGFYVIGDQSLYGLESINFLTCLIRNYYFAASEIIDYYMLYGPISGNVIYNFDYGMVYFSNYSMSASTEDAMYEMIYNILGGFVTIEY
ncbi:MAG: TIR domain-containing protein [Clostridiales bacterium]|nr:TIR domain-containing protein [Clostridiales bacterium]